MAQKEKKSINARKKKTLHLKAIAIIAEKYQFPYLQFSISCLNTYF